MPQGLFISFEGGEGAGKSTQVAKLKDAVLVSGRAVTATREPGGTAGAEDIRALMVSGAVNRWDAMTELLLANAARRDHVTKTIQPALAGGNVVLCDRFVHSTLAYQAGRDGVTQALIKDMHQSVIGDIWPDITFVFDIDPVVAMRRADARDEGKRGRFEAMGADFHADLRERFLTIADTDERCVVVDASQSIDVLHDDIWQTVQTALKSV